VSLGSDVTARKSARPWLGRRLPLVFLLFGVGLFALVLSRLDLTAILSHLRRAGWMLLPAFLAFIGNLSCSAAAWYQTLEPTTRPSFPKLFAIFWAGMAINGVTPGGAAGEVLKGSLVADQAGKDEALTSLVVYNYLTAMSVLAFTALGPLPALIWLDLPGRVLAGLFGVAACFGVVLLGLRLLLRKGLAGRALSLVARLPFVRIDNIEQKRKRAEQVDARVWEYRRRRPGAFRRMILFALLVRVCMTLELYFFLLALMPERSALWLAAFALLAQSASQLIGWIGVLVPGRVGVMESGVAGVFALLGLDPTVGMSAALLRRVRKLTAIGIGLLIGTALGAKRGRAQRDA